MRLVARMEKKKLKKKGKKVVKKKDDPFSVFDTKRRGKDKSNSKGSREEIIKQDKIKLAKRYETIKLFDESIKYYRQAGLEEEAARIEAKMTKLYTKKAKEFEDDGRYDEAAELYDRLNMPDKAAELREKGGSRPYKSLELDLRSTCFDDDESESMPAQPPHSKSLRWEMPNVDMETVGKDIAEESSVKSVSQTRDRDDDNNSEKEDSIPLSASQDMVKAAEKEDKQPSAGSSVKKKFEICPFCGEALNLPKQPKFCPYCKEAFE